MSDQDFAAIGFDIDGDSLPPFASEKAKQLEAEVKRKRSELETVNEKLETNGERVKVMTDHLINVQQELVHTQQLVDAKKNEIETEDHIMALTNRQYGRLSGEITRLQKLMDDYQDRMNSLSNEIMKGNEKLDQFKLEMNWNQEELEQWAIAARQKEEDELTVEKYKRADDSKIRELTLAIEKLTVENSNLRKQLADQVTDTQAKQIEMDKTAEMFRSLHEDRRRLIQQWEEAVNNMKSRDGQLESLGELYGTNLERKKQKEEKMKEKQKFYEEVEGQNKDLETSIAGADRQLVRVRLDHMNVKSQLQDFKDETEVLKNTLSACDTEKTNTKNRMFSMQKQLEQQKDRHGGLHNNFQSHQRSLADSKVETKSKDKKSQDAEKIRSEMLASLKMVEQEMKKAKENLFKESQELYRLRADEATTLGEISGAQSAIKNLQFQISRLDQERQRQQELLYAVDFQSQLMQRKVARVSGERTVEEKEELNKKVEALEKEMQNQSIVHGTLVAQIKRQDADLKTQRRVFSDIEKASKQMKGVMEELELENTIMNRTVAQTVKEKEENLVQHDILRLEVKRLRQQLNTKSESLYSLENRKHQLKISMQEREKEIEVHQEVLKTQLRCTEEEKHNSKIELAERKQKIYNLKMKYETVLNKVKREEGEDGQKSQAYYVLKAAQAKEELQRKGDELDEKIRKAEREIRALENTLGHLLTRNKKYKENFQMASSQNQAELEEKQMLEEQSRAANEVLFRKRRNLAQLDREEEEDTRRYEELEGHLNELRTHLDLLQSAHDTLTHDLADQAPKLERAEWGLNSKKEQATAAGVDLNPEAVPALAIELDGMRDQNKSILHSLHTVLQEHSEDVLPLFDSLCAEKGIQRPSRPPSAAGSGGGSRPSSRGGRPLGR